MHFGIFGKQPSAADHLEDLGLATAALTAFKRDFYVEGLGGCVARSVWSEAVPAGAPIPYDHCLLTVSAEGWVAARFVASQDATGRAQFPLVVCLSGAELRDLESPHLWPWLERQAAAARAAETTERLEQICAAAAAGLPVLSGKASAAARRAWAERNRTGLERTAHALSPQGAGGNRVRVPLQDDAGAEAVWWISYLVQLHLAPVFTVVWRVGARWGDLALTPPATALLQTLFASPDQVPLTTGVPFSISEETRRYAAAALAEWLAAPALFPEPAAAGAGPFWQRLARDFRSWWHS
ncbi:MAG TPA: hypothetical protein VGO11_13520 [Chthoniobacteraceae bacterium]|jgi:hypothetical protein|nr:hypothetical protein [Chthoniobacteraceae bacterium]